jgi:adenosylhomocysteine nucleosidase
MREPVLSLLVLVAVEFEARYLRRRLAGIVPRTVGLRAADLPRVGPALIALRPEAVLITGLVGGCAPDLVPGELILGSPVGPTADGAWLAPDPALAERAGRALAAAGRPHRAGRLLTTPDAVGTPAAKAECWRARGAVGVDMESARVLEWAARAGLPALAVRAVADGPADELPAALVAAVRPDGRLAAGAVLGWAARPAIIAAAFRLWRRSRLAMDGLVGFLAAFPACRP